MINKKLRQKMETNFSTLVRSCYEWNVRHSFILELATILDMELEKILLKH